jgi:hypothetical protein
LSEEVLRKEIYDRAQRLINLEKEIAMLEYRLRECKGGQYIRSGAVDLIRAFESFRKGLRNDLLKKKKYRELLRDEVKRAQERLGVLDND